MKNKTDFLQFVSNPQNVKRILVIRNGLLGDITFITSALNRLSNTFFDSEIDVITGPISTPLLENFPHIRNIIPFNYNLSFFSVVKQIFFFLKLRLHKYDIVVVHEVNSHYTLMGKLAGGKYLVTFENAQSKNADYSIPRPKQVAVLAELVLVQDWTKKINTDKSYLYVTENEIKIAKEKLHSEGLLNFNRIVLINCGNSRGQDSKRQWYNQRFAELADNLIIKQGVTIVFNVGPGEQEEVKKLQKLMRFPSYTISGIRSLMAIIKISKLVIGLDTGPLHMACALGTPVIMLFGYADPSDTGPYDPTGLSKVIAVNLECIHCVHKNPKPTQWNICKDMRPTKCMQEITTEMVTNAANEILNRF